MCHFVFDFGVSRTIVMFLVPVETGNYTVY